MLKRLKIVIYSLFVLFVCAVFLTPKISAYHSSIWNQHDSTVQRGILTLIDPQDEWYKFVYVHEGTAVGLTVEFGDNEFKSGVNFNEGDYLIWNVTHKYWEIDPNPPTHNIVTDLFFSAYLEGISNNKALAIYNGTGKPVNLSGYSVRLFINGSTTSTSTANLTGTLNHGDVYIIVNTTSAQALLSIANLTHAVCNFNGNDAIVLFNSSNIPVDSIGQVGNDPGTAWTSNGVSTMDQTLKRKPNIAKGRTAFDSPFDPSIEWYSHPVDSFSLITTHDVNLYSPVFSGETAFVTNFDNMITLVNLLSKIKAIDDEDGDITHLIQIVSNEYCPGGVYPTQKGTYKITLSVTDTSNNTAFLDVYVLVKDVASPVISGQKTYNQSYTSKLSVSTILSNLSVTDNHDTTGLNIIVKTDNYSSSYSVIGSKTIVFSCTDSSGNEALYTVTVNVIDNIAPVFTAPTTILKPQNEILTLQSILAQVSVNDAIEGTLPVNVVSDNYTGNGNKVGSYDIELSATDSSNNTSYHTITILVKDNVPPVFYVDNYFIRVSDSVTLTQQDIINLLVASGQLVVNPTSTTSINFIQNEYAGNENVPGIYAITVLATSSDGSSKQISLAVIVEEIKDHADVIITPVKNFFIKFWNWLKTPIKEDSIFLNGYYVLAGLLVLLILITALIIKSKNKRSYRYYKYRRR